MEPINDNEVHSEIMEEFNNEPDDFRILFSELSTGGTHAVSKKGAEAVFSAMGMKVPAEVYQLIEEINRPVFNPGDIEKQLRNLTALSQSIHPMYVLAKTEYKKKYFERYPDHIARGEKELKMAKLDADMADLAALRDFLRNCFYIAAKSATTAQSLLRAEVQERFIS